MSATVELHLLKLHLTHSRSKTLTLREWNSGVNNYKALYCKTNKSRCCAGGCFSSLDVHFD